jgi:hypothetical protein
VRGAQIVISMLEAGPTVATVLQAALPALAPNALWIDMSSTQQAEAQAFHALLAAGRASSMRRCPAAWAARQRARWPSWRAAGGRFRRG